MRIQRLIDCGCIYIYYLYRNTSNLVCRGRTCTYVYCIRMDNNYHVHIVRSINLLLYICIDVVG